MLKQAILILCALSAIPAQAMDWQRWFYTPDQRGQKAMQTDQPEVAATQFEDPAWKGSAYYRAKDYTSALESFNQQSDATSRYNQGNALARQGDFDAAIEAYVEAMEKQPDFADAKFNKELLEKLKENQQEQQKPDQPQQDQKPSEQPDQSDQQDSEPQPSDDDQNKQDDAPKPPSDQGQQQAQNQPQPKPDKTENASPHETLSQSERDDIDKELNNIPNDPGGLLRQKFLRDHKRYQQESS